MNLIIHYPNGETKTHKGVKEIAIDILKAKISQFFE